MELMVLIGLALAAGLALVAVFVYGLADRMIQSRKKKQSYPRSSDYKTAPVFCALCGAKLEWTDAIPVDFDLMTGANKSMQRELRCPNRDKPYRNSIFHTMREYRGGRLFNGRN